MKAYMNATRYMLMPYKDHMFLDTADFYAKDLLRKHGVWFRKIKTLSHPEKRLRIVVIRIPRWQEAKFVQALEELLKKLMICGYPEYEATLAEIRGDGDTQQGAPD